MCGLTSVNTQVNGRKTKWMVRECMNGLMAEGLRVIINVTRSMAKGHSIGKMDVGIKVNGMRASSIQKVYSRVLIMKCMTWSITMVN